LTEDQKMEDGKRMFSIFAARMFEQRVLQAYREMAMQEKERVREKITQEQVGRKKLAQERQVQLLHELEDEERVFKSLLARRAKEEQRRDKQQAGFLSLLLYPFTGCYQGRQAAGAAGHQG
ncbi:hypothetical protein H4582DRAFT_1809104, partial [Lactarius indigo]